MYIYVYVLIKNAFVLAEAIVNIEVIIISTIINNLWHNRSCHVNTMKGVTHAMYKTAFSE